VFGAVGLLAGASMVVIPMSGEPSVAQHEHGSPAGPVP